MSNINSTPEKFGLREVAELEFSDGCYQFDTRVVWVEIDTGNLYTARDSGCSCPVPFDDYRNIGDLTPVTIDFLDTLQIESRDAYSAKEGQEFYYAVLQAFKSNG